MCLSFPVSLSMFIFLLFPLHSPLAEGREGLPPGISVFTGFFSSRSASSGIFSLKSLFGSWRFFVSLSPPLSSLSVLEGVRLERGSRGGISECLEKYYETAYRRKSEQVRFRPPQRQGRKDLRQRQRGREHRRRRDCERETPSTPSFVTSRRFPHSLHRLSAFSACTIRCTYISRPSLSWTPLRTMSF